VRSVGALVAKISPVFVRGALLVRGNALFAAIFGFGLVLRVAAVVAYWPAFVSADSRLYLFAADSLRPDPDRPDGYSLLLRLVPHRNALWPEMLLQHAGGLLAGLLIYVLLVRLRVPKWGAALASAPVLLDPWQVALEHYIMTDTTFQLLALAAIVLLVRWKRIPFAVALGAGLLIGLASIVRGVGYPFLIPIVLCVALGQARWRPVLAVLLGAALPIGSYMVWYHHDNGSYAISEFPAHQLYGRLAPIADCATLKLPSYERILCPKAPIGHRNSAQFYVWSAQSPRFHIQPPPGKTAWQVLTNFDKRVIEQQPLTYARVVTKDVLRGFAPTRHYTERGTDPTRWIFETHFPSLQLANVQLVYDRYHLHPQLDKSVAGALSGYAHHFYFPGPVFAACLLIGLLAMAGVGRARGSGLRSAIALFTLTTLLLLFTASGASIFSWRYQIPQFVLLPPAGALGLVALLRRERDPDVLGLGASLRRLLPHKPVREGASVPAQSDDADIGSALLP
jgi:4-amino-4-deoxy-L-arabinose transferase-like glycosyltransferase